MSAQGRSESGDGDPVRPPDPDELPQDAQRPDSVPDYEPITVEPPPQEVDKVGVPHAKAYDPEFVRAVARAAAKEGRTEKTPRVRWWDRQAWSIPAVILGIVAVGGELWGPYGAVLAGLLSMATVTLAVGGDLLSREVRLGVLLTFAALITATVVGKTLGVPRLSTEELPGPMSSTSAPAAAHSDRVVLTASS